MCLRRGKEEEEGEVERRRVVCFWRPDVKAGGLLSLPTLWLCLYVCLCMLVWCVHMCGLPLLLSVPFFEIWVVTDPELLSSAGLPAQ